MLANLLLKPQTETRATSTYDELLNSFKFVFNGQTYQVSGTRDDLALDFAVSSGPIAACIAVRVNVFSEATFKFQPLADTHGKLFGTPALTLLERPWEGAGTSHLLAAAEVDNSVYGNSYWIGRAGETIRLDPRYVNIAVAVVEEDGVVVGQRIVAYAYQVPGNDMAVFLPNEIAHYRLNPDPTFPFRGTSWMRGILADAYADKKMTGYKDSLLTNSAVPGMVVKFEPGVSLEQFKEFKAVMDAKHTGWENVGKVLYMGAGATPTLVGQNMQQLDMKALQGAGESRIASAAGVPASIVGFSEGLQGSALNAGNYGASRRRFADGTIRPLWRAACTAFSQLVSVPSDSRLWFDPSGISFLQEDEKDAADILFTKAGLIRQLVDAGYGPDAAVKYSDTGNPADLIGTHSGLFSVQLMPPTTSQPADTKGGAA